MVTRKQKISKVRKKQLNKEEMTKETDKILFKIREITTK